MHTRPNKPSANLLVEAKGELAHMFSLDAENLRWEVGQKLTRKRSTLFHLTLRSESGVVATAYYKAPYVPEGHQSRNLERTREALKRSRSLGRRFAKLAQGYDIAINLTLAIDPETLEVVTLGLEGSPMGNPIFFMAPATRRSLALDTCRRVGVAVRLLEQIPPPPPEGQRELLWQGVERKLEAARSLLPSEDLSRLEALLGSLLDANWAQPQPLVVAHGDLSTSNVLIMKAKTGLVDFTWIPQVRGFDLARFVHRLRYTTLSHRSWTDALVEATLEGYGDPTAPDQPGWRFTTLQRMIATALQDPPWGRWRRQALRELGASLRRNPGE